MLMGEFHHNIDDKGRLIIPSKFRIELGEKLIVTRGLDKCLFIYSLPEWDKIVKRLKTLPFTNKDARNFTRFFLSGATECEFDRQGRINITSPLVSYADLTKECVVIGANDRLEIWSSYKWEDFLFKNEDNLADIAENLFTSGDYEAL
ncbi:MAG: division/cell wall cluster transcriptional repressor MraZ [Bacilli bacterium]|nr:division/cell wall cluster transcriptional repressor MraZ [Bacilli bacterium]MDD4406944.1 division/cell wall cluster transcriptional repressor MraZ [Bacilli bacterium]